MFNYTVDGVGDENARRRLLEVDLVAQNLHFQALLQEQLQYCVLGGDCGRVDARCGPATAGPGLAALDELL